MSARARRTRHRADHLSASGSLRAPYSRPFTPPIQMNPMRREQPIPAKRPAPPPVERCEWCHWEYPAAEMIPTGGRRLCVGCNAVYLADEDEDEDS